MKARLLAGAGAAIAMAFSAAPAGLAQTPAATQGSADLPTGQIDQLVAPIALYPDPLLSQILMAATYPVEVVEADRWRREPANAALTGDALEAAVERQNWDPSVKSLTPYPQILALMDDRIDWTESLGEAFIANPSAVMDEIQKLRHQAQANGKLGSNAKQTVSDQDGDIDIEPVGDTVVYVPEYDPNMVYGPWSWPGYSPFYFPGYFYGCELGDFGYCWIDWPIFGPFWGWDDWDWRGHRIRIDRARFARLDHGHSPPGGGVWEHDPSHRRGAPYQSPSTSGRFPSVSGSTVEQRQARGYTGGGGGSRETNTPTPTAPPSFQSYDRGAGARTDAFRGQASRMSAPSYAPRSGGFSGGGFHGGGGGHR